ncbi:MAG: VanW family protein, partial [Clostridiales bacterium]|nr:VanW family protein [Clostridiales bacterium]
YSTKYSTSETDRTTNLQLSSKSINKSVIQPGGEFSFNGVVGKRTYDKGYKDAIVYSNGTKTTGIAGGICQVSTTIFNAALLANMEITSRSSHSLKVAYVPNGRDAVVNWGSQDFKFRNSLDVPVKIKVTCSGGTLTGKR